MSRAWRRFTNCRGLRRWTLWTARWPSGSLDFCLRHRWHIGDCRGFAPEPDPVQWSWTSWSPYPNTATVAHTLKIMGLTGTPQPVPELP